MRDGITGSAWESSVTNRWFITRDGKQRHGPFSEQQLSHLASAGRLLPSDMLWREGSAQWIRAESVGGLFAQQPAITDLPEFHYAHLPFFPPDHRRIAFAVDRVGTLTGVSKTVRQFISGGGGSVYSDRTGIRGYFIPIRTTHETTMDLWVLEANGRESSVRISKDVPLKEGHRVTIIKACLDGRSESLCLVLNHTAGEAHFLRRALGAVRPSLKEWLTLSVVISVWLLMCVLLCVANQAIGLFIGVGALCLGCGFIFIRWALLRHRFTRHSMHVARLLL